MKKIRFRHIVTLLAIVAMVGVGSSAMAYRGWMNSEGAYGDCPGFAEGGRGGGCGRYADEADLTEEQRTQLEAVRKAYFEETRELRDQMRDKAEALHEALNADPVEAEEAKALQAELSQIRADLDQKRLSHRIEMQKLFPDFEGGPRHKGGRGFGRRGGCGRW
jgi:Spy/CpxP family protein refolding chaperone